MRRSECIFVVVGDPRLIAPAIRLYGGGVELVVAKTPRAAEKAVAAARSAIPVVDLARRDGAERAVALARSGAKIVVCAHATARREERLKGLAPTSFVLRAATADDLARALRAALG